jgi:hypothetical protein
MASDQLPGGLPTPAADVFEHAAPHSVPAAEHAQWGDSLSRWWRQMFRRDAYARGADAVRPGHGGHQFFQHLIEHESERPAAAPVERRKE